MCLIMTDYLDTIAKCHKSVNEINTQTLNK